MEVISLRRNHLEALADGFVHKIPARVMPERRSIDHPNHSSPEDLRRTTTNHIRPQTPYEDRVHTVGSIPPVRDSYSSCNVERDTSTLHSRIADYTRRTFDKSYHSSLLQGYLLYEDSTEPSGQRIRDLATASHTRRQRTGSSEASCLPCDSPRP